MEVRWPLGLSTSVTKPVAWSSNGNELSILVTGEVRFASGILRQRCELRRACPQQPRLVSFTTTSNYENNWNGKFTVPTRPGPSRRLRTSLAYPSTHQDGKIISFRRSGDRLLNRGRKTGQSPILHWENWRMQWSLGGDIRQGVGGRLGRLGCQLGQDVISSEGGQKDSAESSVLDKIPELARNSLCL